MKNAILAPLLILTLLFTVPLVALAQSATDANVKDWQGLRNLKPGKRILVETKQGRIIGAKFVSVAGSELTLSEDGNTLSLEQRDIQRVSRLKARWSRRTTALIGGVIGIVVGAAIGAKVDSNSREAGPPFGDAPTAGMATAIYATLGGAGVGYLLGGKRKDKVLYEAK